MTFAELVQPLLERRDLTDEQASQLMNFLIGGDATDAQIGGILLSLRVKGCTTRELASFARVMREKAAVLSHRFDDLVDTCGTGGGKPTFNISTAAAVVACAAGVRIAKHGNRSMGGMGSADVLEQLGVRLGGDAQDLTRSLETLGIVFLYAPAHHPATRHVAMARRELGLRTVFNQLGPLANPAGARRQVIGVYDAGLMRSMGEALRQLECERALLVHGLDGLDEVSPTTETEFVQVWDGKVSTGRLSPGSFGLEPISAEAVAPGVDLADCVDILREAVSDVGSDRARAVLPSAAAAIWIAGLEESLPAAAARAQAVISSGQASAKLDEISACGGENHHD